jgi:CheY-like chemotaxis protein
MTNGQQGFDPSHFPLEIGDDVTTKQILLAEDDPRDVELTLAAFEEQNLANRVVVARDGVEALDYLYRRGQFAERPPGNPVVVLLDLKMPRVDGLEVLRQVKSDPALKTIPMVVLTSSSHEQDIVESYDLGVNSYVVKPVAFDRFVEVVKQLGLFWVLTNEPPPKGAEL